MEVLQKKTKALTLLEIANKQAKHPKKSQNHNGNSAYKEKLINEELLQIYL